MKKENISEEEIKEEKEPRAFEEFAIDQSILDARKVTSKRISQWEQRILHPNDTIVYVAEENSKILGYLWGGV